MSTFIKELIAKKISQLSPEELLTYSKQYGFSITNAQAKTITTYLKTHHIDPFSADNRAKMLQELARITDLNTAKKAQKLFNEIVKSHGLESLFY
ncbi:DUF2624 family protein [Virgibacillus dakarensis]|uniref:DUF2624 domain-containing protein n=1 Tax=Lentibacillus populi TaxID=1827502 RepID=A0A9W5TTZ4_9BACI|nr:MULTISPECIES: DUF2624 domain-containing protein [Bacillaceae]MBT2214482.1 DUF2624 family protein [Virgibacillus dakarensis]MTW84087.1 DUF2624 family protein [Virgibacillus dakarensis]GGB29178.1 hypothetical protein GCM10011409_03160 [Lentibacillus populi]